MTTDTPGIVASPPVETLEVLHEDIVLDPAFQCRVAMNQSVIAEYAEAMDEGAEFPPVEAVRIDGVLHLVDGWHRVKAYNTGVGGWKRSQIPMKVRVWDGTRRDALLRAVQANGNHGLRRSQDDKRRAIRALLMDPEFCKLSSRELGKLARVSHTFVNKTRTHYGLTPKQQLTDAEIQLADGEVPQVWQDISLEASDRSYLLADIEAARKAPTLKALRKVGSNYGHSAIILKAQAQRLSELQDNAWPWDDDKTERDRRKRWKALDNVKDIEKAILCWDLPVPPKEAWGVWKLATGVGRAESWDADTFRKGLKGRQALLEKLEARLERSRSGSSASGGRRGVWDIAKEDFDGRPLDEQLAAVAKLKKSDLGQVLFWHQNRWPTEVSTALIDRALAEELVHDDHRVTFEACKMPGCTTGRLARGRWRSTQCCVCGAGAHAHERLQEKVDTAALWLRTNAFVGIRVGLGEEAVLVDQHAVRLLRLLQYEGIPQVEIDAAARAWREADRTGMLVGEDRTRTDLVKLAVRGDLDRLNGYLDDASIESLQKLAVWYRGREKVRGDADSGDPAVVSSLLEVLEHLGQPDPALEAWFEAAWCAFPRKALDALKEQESEPVAESEAFEQRLKDLADAGQLVELQGLIADSGDVEALEGLSDHLTTQGSEDGAAVGSLREDLPLHIAHARGMRAALAALVRAQERAQELLAAARAEGTGAMPGAYMDGFQGKTSSHPEGSVEHELWLLGKAELDSLVEAGHVVEGEAAPKGKQLEDMDWWPELVEVRSDYSLRELAERFGATPGAINNALKRNGLARTAQPPGPRGGAK